MEGKVKEIAGRAQRQAGEVTGDHETQAMGAAQPAEGKIRNVMGKSESSCQKCVRGNRHDVEIEAEDEESTHPRRRAS